jgi:hypothetical protein
VLPRAVERGLPALRLEDVEAGRPQDIGRHEEEARVVVHEE